MLNVRLIGGSLMVVCKNTINGFIVMKNNSIFQHFKKLRKNSNGIRIINNLKYLALLEITTHLFPLVTTPYLARVIGVQGFGLIAIGVAVVAYFQSFVEYGFNFSSVRDVSRLREDTNSISRIFFETMFAKMVLMLFSSLILVFLTCLVPFFKENQVVIWCTFLSIPAVVMNTDWIFQALEDMKFITIRSIVTKFVFTIPIFIIINKPEDYFWQPLLVAGGMIASSIWGGIQLRKKYNIHLYMPTQAEIVKQIKNNFSLFVSLFLPTIYTQLNTLLLSGFNGKQATGIYSGGSKFTSIAYNLFQIISRAFYPYFSRHMDKHNMYVRFSLLLSIVFSLLLFLFAEPIVLIFLGSEFKDTIVVLRIVSFTPVAMSLMNSYGVNYLILKGKEKLMRNIIIGVTILGLCLGTYGAIYYSFIGVAVTSLITQFVRALTVTYYARKLSTK